MKKHLYIILFTISLFHTSLFAQWLQQTLLVSGHINDLVFLNKDTGFVAMDNSNFLRTTNGGTNWTLSSNFRILILNKIDSVTAYGMGAINSKIYRTFNGGTTWDSVSPAGSMCWISFISRDTGWISSLGGIYKTTDGGLTASFISNQQTCGKLTFLKTKYGNENYGFMLNNGNFFKTINSGVNWINILNSLGSGNYNTVFFLNKDTGWCYYVYSIRPPEFLITTNSGINWITQYIDSNINATSEIFFLNYRIGWAGRAFNKIWATSNGGLNWGTQNVPIVDASQIYFIDTLLGWTGKNGIAKTTNGGGNITYSAVEPIGNVIPHEYKLKQNYPNPFNPGTDIEFSLPTRSFVKIIIYDILGREISVLVNEELNAGTFEINWDASNYPSGVYFYKLVTDKYIESKKMVLVK